MTYLRNHCLGVLPMSHDEVNEIFKTANAKMLGSLCMSHERLRAELVGLEIVAKENEEIVDRLRKEIADCREEHTRMLNAIDTHNGFRWTARATYDLRTLSAVLASLESILNPPKTEPQP